MCLKHITFDNLSITDWIQAFGAVIAIIAAIIGFITLFQRDINKQKQIDSLVKLAEQSELQTKEMRETNKTIVKQFNLLLVAQKQRKSDIKPSFWIPPDISWQPANFSGAFSIFNQGKSATIDSVVYLKGNNVLFEFPVKFIGDNGSVEFYAKGQSDSTSIININIYFKDRDGNKYYQTFNSSQNGFKIEPPVSLN